MQKLSKKVMAVVSAVAMSTCMMSVSLTASAFDNDSTRALPYADAFWKKWKQGDSAWGSQSLGGSGAGTMASAGCVITSIAVAAQSYGVTFNGSSSSITPLTVLQRAKSTGAITTSGDYVWGNTSKLFNGLVYAGKQENLTTESAMASSVKAKLSDTSKENAVIICFSGQHYVLADHMVGNTIYVFDPATGGVVTLATALARKSSYKLSGYFYFNVTCQMRGDINNDGRVDTTDSRLALQYAVGSITLTPAQLKAADFNGDGVVDTTDSRLIMQS